MPTYAYTCPNNHTFDDRRPYAQAADHPTVCPQCGESVCQVLHMPPVFYRHAGWRRYHPDDAARGETVKEEICVSD